MSVQVSLWSNSTICLTDLPPFKMNSVTENRNVMEWGYILYILPRNGWHLNCIADLQMIHLKISYTYIYIWLVQLLLFSYLQGTMWSQSCRDNRCVILNSTFFSKWNSSEVWRFYVIWNFYNNVRIKNIFLGQKFLWFICQYPIKKYIIICLGYIQI
jgi:hypothetical protein